jgi:hypothetical protein
MLNGIRVEDARKSVNFLLSNLLQHKNEPAQIFDRYQKIVVNSYNEGEHLVTDPVTVHDCGDGLLRFLLTELSEKEDCDSYDCAIQRLDSAISQLSSLKRTFESEALEVL